MIIYYISVADLRCTVPPAQSAHVLLYIYLSALGRVLRWVGKSIYYYYYSIYRCSTVLSRELVVKRIKFDFAAAAAATTTTTQFCSPAAVLRIRFWSVAEREWLAGWGGETRWGDETRELILLLYMCMIYILYINYINI